MKTELSPPVHDDDAAVVPQSRPRVVVVYEDFDATLKVGGILRRLSDDTCKDAGSAAAFWKFDLLNYPALFEQAVSEAIGAEFILLALHGNFQLPPAVTTWIQRWSHQRTRPPRLLIASLDESAEHAATADHILSNLNSLASATELEWIPIFSDSADWQRQGIGR